MKWPCNPFESKGGATVHPTQEMPALLRGERLVPIESESPLPIFVNHNPTNCIGNVKFQNGNMMIEFASNIHVTREQFFSTFDAEATFDDVFEENGVMYIRKATIKAFNLHLQVHS